MTEQQDTRKLGPFAVGESITYHDRCQASERNSGRIIHVIWATPTHELTYVVTPDIGADRIREVAASEVIE